MTIMFTDDPDIEAAEYDESEADGFGESDGESDLDSEESRAERRRRARSRAQHVALARRRQAAARARAVSKRQPSAVSTPSTEQRATASAVRTLDLETKVQEDAFRNAIKAQNKRISRSEYAAVAGAAVNQFIETFEAPDNPFAKAALRFSPLLLLAPQSKGRGVESLIKDPRVIGAAVVGGVVVFGDLRNKKNKVHKVTIFAPDTIAKNTTVTLVADVLDGNDKPMPNEKVTWASLGPDVATVDSTTGVLATSTTKGGSVAITATSATATDVVGKKFITVTA